MLKRWYRHASSRAPIPSRADMEKVMGDYATLYRREHLNPLGSLVKNHVTTFRLNDDVLLETDV